MHELGDTRSIRRADHILQTPDTFVRAPLPGMRQATAIVHAAPAIGARFMQYTVEFEAGGSMAGSSAQRFVYVLAGEVASGTGRQLGVGDFAYYASNSTAALEASSPARAAVIEKTYEPLDGTPVPIAFTGRERDLAVSHVADDPWLEVRALVPDTPSFDFRVNTLTYHPGATLPMVEVHVMEHGLLMLEGGGIYRLGHHWYPVTAGDFIWMAAYCPQWFGALGKAPAKYLLYKDWGRLAR